jgi:uncharacterized membrane protein YdbT with pleckstrin-like domain
LSYVRHVLQPGENLLHESRIHWMIFIPSMLLFLVAIAGFIVYAGVEAPDDAHILSYSLMAVGLVSGLVTFVAAWFRRWTTEVAVTDRRIIYKHGFINRHTVEMNMDKVESVDVDQTVFGRLFDYGDITVRGTGSGIEPLRKIDSPLAFRNAVTAR